MKIHNLLNVLGLRDGVDCEISSWCDREEALNVTMNYINKCCFVIILDLVKFEINRTFNYSSI